MRQTFSPSKRAERSARMIFLLRNFKGSFHSYFPVFLKKGLLDILLFCILRTLLSFSLSLSHPVVRLLSQQT